MMRRALYIFAGLVAVLVIAVLGVLAGANSDWGRSRIAALVADATEGGPVAVRIGAIEGRLPDRVVLTDLRLSDAEGEFARVGRLVLDWRIVDLAGGRIGVSAVDVTDAALDRLPVLPEAAAEEPTPDTGPPTLKFEGPGIEIVLDRFTIASLALGAAVAGEAVEVRANLSAAMTGDQVSAKGWIEAARDVGEPMRADIDVALIPSSGVLRADLVVREPEGGWLAGLLEIEGRPPLAVSISGEGGLERWQGALEGGFGPGANLDLDLVVATDASGYRLTIDGSVAAAALAPEEVRDLVGRAIAIELAAHVRPDGSASLDRLDVTLPAASVRASAAVNAEGVPTTAQALISAPDLAAFAAVLGLSVSGDATVEAVLEDGGKRAVVAISGHPTVEGISLNDLSMSLSATAPTPLAGAPTTIDVTLDGGVATPTVEGVDAVTVLGPRVTLAAAGSIALETLDARFERIEIVSDGLTMDGTADLAGGRRLVPALHLTIPDLARLRDLAGVALSGSAMVDLEGAVDLDPLAANLTVAVSADGLGFGDPALDAVVGAAPSMLAGVTLDADQRLEIAGLGVRLAAAWASGDATLALTTGDIGGRVDVVAADLAKLAEIAGVDLSGSAVLATALGGTLDAPAASASWRVDDLAVDGTAVEQITGSATVSGLPDRPEGGVSSRAILRGEPVNLSFAYALADDLLRVTGLRIDGLGVDASGEIDLNVATTLASGAASLSVADLGIVGSALDLPLTAGRVAGDVRLTGSRGQGAGVALQVNDLALSDGTKVESVRLDGALSDISAIPSGRVDLTVSGAETADAELETATVGADIADGVARVTADLKGAVGPSITLSALASIPLDPDSAPIVVERLEATVDDVKIRQMSPLRIALAPTLRVSDLDLAVDDGRISGHATLDPTALDVAVALRDLPVALARLADRTLILDGRIDGDVMVSGPIENPVAALSLSTLGVRTLDPEFAELPPLVAEASMRLADRRADARLSASIGDGAQATVTARIDGRAGDPGSPPIFDDVAAVEARVDADLDLGKVSGFMPLDLLSLGGQAAARLSAGGTLGTPVLAGAVTIDGGEVDVPSAGLYLRDLTVRVDGEGENLVIRTFEARAAGGGSLKAAGTISADPTTGFPADITVSAREFNAVDMDLASVSLDLDLALSGALPEYLIAGKITVLPTEIRIPDSLPPSVVSLDVVERRDGRIVVDNHAPETTADDASAPLRLDLAIDIPGAVFVRGRGLDSEWGGALTVKGLADAPVVDGELGVRRGGLTALGRLFDFERGRIAFDGGPAENLTVDMRLTTEVTDIKAAVVVGGRASAPDISLESDPALPEEDILSHLLFGSDKAELTPVQALKLARSAAVLSGSFGSGPGVTDQVRDALGVDTLDVDAANNDDGSVGASLSVGKYIAPGVFLKLEQGLSGTSSRAVVEVEVTDNISVETDVGADSQSRVGVNWKLDY